MLLSLARLTPGAARVRPSELRLWAQLVAGTTLALGAFVAFCYLLLTTAEAVAVYCCTVWRP
jgi:hypothetical protein